MALAFSKANFQRSRAASRAEVRKGGCGGFRLSSSIINLSALLLMFLGELSGWAIWKPVDGRGGLAGVFGLRCGPVCRSRPVAARLLAAPNSSP